MSEGNIRPDVARQVRQLQTNVSDLQRRRLPAFGTGGPATIPFSYPGALANGVLSPRWYMEGASLTIAQVRISLTAAASADHTIDVLLNGSAVATYTLHSGNETEITPVEIEVRNNDYLQVLTVSVFDSNLSVILAAT